MRRAVEAGTLVLTTAEYALDVRTDVTIGGETAASIPLVVTPEDLGGAFFAVRAAIDCLDDTLQLSPEVESTLPIRYQRI
ncbi:MAG: hypothetical protein ACT4OX_05040 [Actinomycetota bacterium]